jgi:hypothetical protein
MSTYRSGEPPTTLPRAVVRRPEAQGGIRWLARFFIIPHVLVGLGMLVALLLSVMTVALGAETQGEVVSSELKTTHRKSGIGYEWDVVYRFQDDGTERQGERSVSVGTVAPGPDPRFAPGRPVRVWRVSGLPLLGSELLLADESRWRSALPVALSALLWNGILLAITYQLWFVPFRAWRLCRWGAVFPGRITAKRTRASRNIRYIVDFEMQHGPHTRKASMTVSSAALWNAVSEGQAVQVLCDASGRGGCVVYECADHAWA